MRWDRRTRFEVHGRTSFRDRRSRRGMAWRAEMPSATKKCRRTSGRDRQSWGHLADRSAWWARLARRPPVRTAQPSRRIRGQSHPPAGGGRLAALDAPSAVMHDRKSLPAAVQTAAASHTDWTAWRPQAEVKLAHSGLLQAKLVHKGPRRHPVRMAAALVHMRWLGRMAAEHSSNGAHRWRLVGRTAVGRTAVGRTADRKRVRLAAVRHNWSRSCRRPLWHHNWSRSCRREIWYMDLTWPPQPSGARGSLARVGGHPDAEPCRRWRAEPLRKLESWRPEDGGLERLREASRETTLVHSRQ